ncbi:MAG: DsbA family protein [Steroidobacteraceae bacterium]
MLRLAFVLLPALGAACASSPTPPAAADATPPVEFNMLGREDAPVSIIEFTDLQCPYCARFATQVFPEIRRNYIDTGKVRFASRDLPLPFHAFALPAAVAARCAGEQGKFWDFREALFAGQSRLGSAPYDELARRFGMDAGRFDACRRDGRQEANVRADLALAQSQGIRSTPSFVIGRVVNGSFEGEIVSGARPYEEFAARIDTLLGAAD